MIHTLISEVVIKHTPMIHTLIPVYYYVFVVFTTLFYSKLRPTFEPDYSMLEQTSYFKNFVCTTKSVILN